MGKQKTSDDLMEIMSAQLDSLTSESVTDEEIRCAEAIANMIGKCQKQSALIMAYAEHIEAGGRRIEMLEPR